MIRDCVLERHRFILKLQKNLRKASLLLRLRSLGAVVVVVEPSWPRQLALMETGENVQRLNTQIVISSLTNLLNIPNWIPLFKFAQIVTPLALPDKNKNKNWSPLHRPSCADGSRPQKPEEEGAPPQCDDGNTPVRWSSLRFWPWFSHNFIESFLRFAQMGPSQRGQVPARTRANQCAGQKLTPQISRAVAPSQR